MVLDYEGLKTDDSQYIFIANINLSSFYSIFGFCLEGNFISEKFCKKIQTQDQSIVFKFVFNYLILCLTII